MEFPAQRLGDLAIVCKKSSNESEEVDFFSTHVSSKTSKKSRHRKVHLGRTWGLSNFPDFALAIVCDLLRMVSWHPRLRRAMLKGIDLAPAANSRTT